MKLNNIEVEILEEIDFKPLEVGSNNLKYKEKCCIYCLYNTVNNKFYIGSTLELRRRISNHRKDLIAQKHHSEHLQKAFNKYGVESFKVFIIELTNRGDKILREQYWLDLLTPYEANIGYNIGKVAQKAFLNKSHKDISKFKISIGKGKPLLQIDLRGNIIYEFHSTNIASKVFSCSQATISLACRKDSLTKGFIWIYKEELLLDNKAIVNKVFRVNSNLEKTRFFKKTFGKRSLNYKLNKQNEY